MFRDMELGKIRDGPDDHPLYCDDWCVSLFVER
jgi:hypothetical protein